MQLSEDRQQLIAHDNIKLIERISEIMSSSQRQPGSFKVIGKNEAFRKRESERVRVENKRMELSLQLVLPILSSAKLEKDYKEHKIAARTLRKRIIRSKTVDSNVPIDSTGSLFLTKLCFQREQVLEGHTLSSIADFRRHVISSRKLEKNIRPSLKKNGAQLTDEFMLFHTQSEK